MAKLKNFYDNKSIYNTYTQNRECKYKSRVGDWGRFQTSKVWRGLEALRMQ